VEKEHKMWARRRMRIYVLGCSDVVGLERRK
jgi:hypothetical protein